MTQHRIERLNLTTYVIFADDEQCPAKFHSVLSALEFLESPEHPLEALAYTTLGDGCSVPTNKQLSAARDGREAMHSAIRDSEDNSWSWR